MGFLRTMTVTPHGSLNTAVTGPLEGKGGGLSLTCSTASLSTELSASFFSVSFAFCSLRPIEAKRDTESAAILEPGRKGKPERPIRSRSPGTAGDSLTNHKRKTLNPPGGGANGSARALSRGRRAANGVAGKGNPQKEGRGPGCIRQRAGFGCTWVMCSPCKRERERERRVQLMGMEC